MSKPASIPTRRRFLALAAAMGAGHAQASSCTSPAISAPADVALGNGPALLVTHASAEFDARMTTKHGIDTAVRVAKARGIPVIYLRHDGDDSAYFAADCAPDHWVRSDDGEIPFELASNEVLLAGGHLERCLAVTAHDVLSQWAGRGDATGVRFTMTYLMDAIYSDASLIDDDAPYAESVRRFLSIATYGRPVAEKWPKLSLLETIGAIRSPQRERSYLESVLPHYARSLPPTHGVEMVIDDEPPIVLRPAAKPSAARVRFRFVNSADALEEG
ncbi:MAG: hypothetical protein R3E48_08465 [Burkholderiaceae bacterium]